MKSKTSSSLALAILLLNRPFQPFIIDENFSALPTHNQASHRKSLDELQPRDET